jgi:hypothetical protein
LTRAGERESRETGDKGIKPKLVSKKMKDPNILSQVKFQNYDVPSSSLSFLGDHGNVEFHKLQRANSDRSRA